MLHGCPSVRLHHWKALQIIPADPLYAWHHQNRLLNFQQQLIGELDVIDIGLPKNWKAGLRSFAKL